MKRMCMLNTIVCDINKIAKLLETNYEDEWRVKLLTKPKLRTYILFKENYVTEDYVKYCNSRLKRSLLAQTRLGILPLSIEIGRFRNIKLEERLCILCNQREIENALHFVCKCPFYAELRNDLYYKIQRKNDSFLELNEEEKFVYLFKVEWKLLAESLGQKK